MRTRLVPFAAVAAILVALALPSVAAAEGTWTVLAGSSITSRNDMDTVPVNVRRGDFTAIKLVVSGAAVQFREVIVHFAQGPDQKVVLGDLIAADAESTPIALEGGDRIIRSVELRYDAASFQGKSARVTVFGLR